MQRFAKFGYVFKHKATGKIHGTSIDVESIKELKEYEQVPKGKVADEAKTETPKEETSYFTPKPRRTE